MERLVRVIYSPPPRPLPSSQQYFSCFEEENIWQLESIKSIHVPSTKHNILSLKKLCHDYMIRPRQEQSPIHLKV